MTDHWFKPKAYGYGASPANWKGWAATVAFVLVVLAFTLVLIVRPSEAGTGPSGAQITAFLVLSAASAIAFIGICRAKTDGEWRWRWGKHDGGDRGGRP